MKKILGIILACGFVCALSISAHASLTDGLVAYYPFNGNANDESGNGNDGTVYGATLSTDRFDETGKAYYFDGSNDYIRIENSPDFSFNNQSFSISVWTKFQNTSWVWLVDFPGQTQYSYYGWKPMMEFYLQGIEGFGDIAFHMVDPDAQHFRTKCTDCAPDMYDGEWHQYSVTYNSETNTAKLYFDGDFVVSNSSSQHVNEFENWQCIYIGRSSYLGRYLKGYLDELSIYNRVLSDTEICQLSGRSDCGGYSAPANTIAASYGKRSLVGSGTFNALTLLLIPVGAVLALRILRRKR